MNLPDFICIGAQKAGTTWLHAALSQNPSIWLPPIKELHYFNRAHWDDERKNAAAERARRQARRARRRQSDALGKHVARKKLANDDFLTEDWYRGIFSAPEREGKCAGEITPAYLMLASRQIEAMKAMLPDVRLIVFIREPLSRDLSQLRMTIGRSKMIPRNEADWRALFEGHLKKRERGEYAKALPRWWRHYPREQFLIVPFGCIRRKPTKLVERIEDFIGAEPFRHYEALDSAVHQSDKVPIPQWVIDELEARAEPQREFLRENLGPEFLDRSK